ncbi:SagB/ThcOx family dehydrogenase [Paludibaculum fermentans]|uniref:SagB/ThcOx family dehydrogenase n=1 Tax=Paludibaculum fermentans TaxID=1473598 RepID=A0A7S7SL12_PALFE|nr:SagB/ThcOx family dehydrogenase [Paludibaculum fermentans]QOY87966.1 SagB/ThcOx family dehydrogenase [Paludibaculum fermentans]
MPPPTAPVREPTADSIVLPVPPALPDGPTLDHCLRNRRSSRSFLPDSLTLAETSRLLWAAQGYTGLGGLRTAPSAGAFYPVRSYLLAASVKGLAAGFYGFDTDAGSLRLLRKGERRKSLARAVAGQTCVEECAVALLLTGWYKRAAREFGDAAPRLAAMECGHIGQNFCLQATALGLGAIGLGRLDPEAVRLLLRLPEDEEPLYLLLAGRV